MKSDECLDILSTECIYRGHEIPKMKLMIRPYRPTIAASLHHTPHANVEKLRLEMPIATPVPAQEG